MLQVLIPSISHRMADKLCLGVDYRHHYLRLGCSTRCSCWPTSEGQTDWVNPVCFSPDGKWSMTGSDDKTVHLWEARTGTPDLPPLKGHTGSVHFSPDGQQMVSGSSDNTVHIWDTQTGAPVGVPLEGHTSIVTSVHFSLDDKFVYPQQQCKSPHFRVKRSSVQGNVKK
jgi:WD40 repeat protein